MDNSEFARTLLMYKNARIIIFRVIIQADILEDFSI